jgi:thioredoxin-dependent peroxiredoxin
MHSAFAVIRGIVIIVAVLILIAVLGYRAANGSDQAPAVGAQAPAFTLPSQTGAPVSLSDFKGKWVVLYFYPKDFSSGCTIEAHNFQRDLAQYEKLNAAIVGVSVDSADSHQKFCTQEGLNFKLLADTDHKVSETYGSVMNLGVKKLSSRHTFIINPNGVIVKEYLDVKAGEHSTEVLKDLAELQAQAGSK